VKREDLVVSFEKIEPDKAAEKRMLNNIISHSGKEKRMAFDFRKAIPALGLVLVLAGGVLAYDMMTGRNRIPSPEYAIDNSTGAREDMIAPLLNQFEIDGRHYILLSDDLRAEYGFSQHINESDIGEKITTITTSVDPSLIGGEVYEYEPAGSEAVVVVKKGDILWRFSFFTFESYNNNQDEDAIEYLKIYGINKAEDIAKVQFIVHSEQSKIEGKLDVRGELTGQDEIEKFYNYYSILKNSSDKYFDRLFNFNPDGGVKGGVEIDVPNQVSPVPADAPDQNIVHPVAPDSAVSAPDHTGYAEDLPLTDNSRTPAEGNAGSVSKDNSDGMMDMGDTGTMTGGTAPAWGPAGNPLADPVTIRIYNHSGVYLETIYYRNIGFISRHEINEEFAAFIESCLN
jgi:hypothetical protein